MIERASGERRGERTGIPIDLVSPALRSIMTAEDYSRVRHEVPYTFVLENTRKNKQISYFGARHTSNPKNPQFKAIETAFNTANPDIVFIEGVSGREKSSGFGEQVRALTREQAIHTMGEPGFTAKLAVEKGIEWNSPEPSDEILYSFLLVSGFSKEQIFAWHVLRALSQYGREPKREGFEAYAQRGIKGFQRTTDWQGFDYSYKHALDLGEQISGTGIDVENCPNAGDLTDPIPWVSKRDQQTVLNRVAEKSTLFRDRQIVTDIMRALETHRRGFIVYGASHAVMQEPALKMALDTL